MKKEDQLITEQEA